MSSQIDLIVIGDSKSGNMAVKAIAANNPTIKIAFVSKNFKSTTTRDFLNVEYIKEEAVLIDYRNRLFGCYLKNGDRLYSTHLVIATGLKYSPLLIGNRHVPNVFHNTDDVPKTAKHQPAVVIGKDTNMDIKFALAVAKKYKQVYFCTTSIALSEASKANIKKLEETANIAILPNTTLAKVTVKDNAVISVDLDSYSTITCSAVYAKTNAVPDVCFIPDNIISKNNGYLETKNNAESTKVPRCYAIGECAAKSTNKMTQFMVEDILKDFNGGR